MPNIVRQLEEIQIKMEDKEITLRVEYGRRHRTVYDDGETQWQAISLPAALGNLPVDRFRGYRIVEIESDRLVIACGEETHVLRPGETIVISREIDGREWADGCVYDGYTYTLKITWQ